MHPWFPQAPAPATRATPRPSPRSPSTSAERPAVARSFPAPAAASPAAGCLAAPWWRPRSFSCHPSSCRPVAKRRVPRAAGPGRRCWRAAEGREGGGSARRSASACRSAPKCRRLRWLETTRPPAAAAARVTPPPSAARRRKVRRPRSQATPTLRRGRGSRAPSAQASAPPRQTAAARVAARWRRASGWAWVGTGTAPRPRGQAARVPLCVGAFAPPRPASRGTCSSEASRILQPSPSVVAAARI